MIKFYVKTLSYIAIGVYGILGLLYFFNPGIITMVYHVQLPTAMAKTEIMALFGGFSMGFSGILWYQLYQSVALSVISMELIISTTGLVIARIFGLLQFGVNQPVIVYELVSEIIFLSLVMVGYYQLKKTKGKKELKHHDS